MRTRVANVVASIIVITTVGCVNEVDEGNVMMAGEVEGQAEQALTTRCASDDTVKGIDVSYYQGTINWNAVKNDGVKYAFIRVSDGLNYRDSKFDSNWRGAKNAGVIRGAYQFFRPGQNPEAQADLLINKIGGRLQNGDLPPVIDVEDADGVSASAIRDRVRRWSRRIENRLGVKPIIYTGPYFWQDNVGGDFNDHKLWIAHYGTSCPLVPPTWGRWTFHQHTSSGRVDGIGGNVDMNRFNGNMNELRALTVDDRPRACVSGRFDGAFCDDDNHPNEAYHNKLARQLDVSFHCSDIAGEPAYCPKADATRAHAIYVLGKAADMPVNGHPNAFVDDNNHAREKYFNAAKVYGIYGGNSDREVKPDGKISRSTLAVVLSRMYKLPATDTDYFDDDDNSPNEKHHNRVAEAGLIGGYDDGRGRRDFKGSDIATRSTLAVVAVRARDKELVPVWKIPDACLSGNFTGQYCDDDNSSAEAAHDRLATEIGIPLACRDLAGQPTMCPSKKVTRAGAVYVLTKAAGIPLEGHPDAFSDDDNHPREPYLNAAKAFGIITGYEGGTKARPTLNATRDTLAIILARMYDLPDTDVDYFTDDNGSRSEHWHNKVAAAGLFTGFNDGNGGREFRGDQEATRSALAVLAVRAKDAGLIPVWQ